MKRMLAIVAAALMLAMPALAQDQAPEPQQEPPVEAPAEPAPEPPIGVAVVVEAEPPAEEPAVEPEPVEAEPPVAEPEPVTLAGAFAALTGAITAGGSHAVTVEAANENLMAARGALATAEDQHAAAMDGQATVETGISAAAQALVDHLRATFGVN